MWSRTYWAVNLLTVNRDVDHSTVCVHQLTRRCVVNSFCSRLVLMLILLIALFLVFLLCCRLLVRSMISFVWFALVVVLLLLQSVWIVFCLIHNCLSESVSLSKDAIMVAAWSFGWLMLPCDWPQLATPPALITSVLIHGKPGPCHFPFAVANPKSGPLHTLGHASFSPPWNRHSSVFSNACS